MTTTALKLADGDRARLRGEASQPRTGDLEPLKRLMLAVLDQAVNDFRTYAVVLTPRGRRLFADVEAWFDSPAAGPFDFETICDATGFHPDFIRKGVRSAVGRTAAPVANEDRSRLRAYPVRPTLSSAPIAMSH